MEAGARPAAPGFVAADVGGVEREAEKGEPVGDAGCEWRAKEADAQGVDEEVVEEGIERGGEEEDVGAWAHDLWGMCMLVVRSCGESGLKPICSIRGASQADTERVEKNFQKVKGKKGTSTIPCACKNFFIASK